jgi:peptide/nickel transport system substrate-binding protein
VLKDTTLDLRLPKEPEKINPIYFPNSTAREVYQYIFLPLAEYDPETYQMTPLLIKSIPNAELVSDGPYKGFTRYTFEILEEARWDDGKPVTGEDYIFTLKAIMHPGTSASAYRSVVSKFGDVVIDPSNVKKVSVFFDTYFMLAKEAVVNIEILPKHIYDPNQALDKYTFAQFKKEDQIEKLTKTDSLLLKFGEESNTPKYTKDIVSSCGPYKLAAYNSQNIILEKKKDYWGKDIKQIGLAQYPEKIIIHFLPDETAAIARLQNGELDVLSNISTANFDQLKKNAPSEYSFQNPQLMKSYNILVNTQDPMLGSIKVRKALASVIDIKRIITTFENGMGDQVIGPISPSKPYYNKKIAPYSYDIDKAKSWLSEDGWVDSNKDGSVDKKLQGKQTELNIDLIYSGELGKNIALLIKEDAMKAGIKLNIIQKDIKLARSENIETGKYQLFMQSSTQDLGFEELGLRFHSSNAEAGKGNHSLYKNPKVDELIDKINETTSDDERMNYYREIQVILHEDLPNIYLYAPKEKIIISKRWIGSTNAKRPGYQANTFKPNT